MRIMPAILLFLFYSVLSVQVNSAPSEPSEFVNSISNKWRKELNAPVNQGAKQNKQTVPIKTPSPATSIDKTIPSSGPNGEFSYTGLRAFSSYAPAIGRNDAKITYGTKRKTQYRNEFEKLLRDSENYYSSISGKSTKFLPEQTLRRYDSAFKREMDNLSRRNISYTEHQIESSRRSLESQMNRLRPKPLTNSVKTGTVKTEKQVVSSPSTVSKNKSLTNINPVNNSQFEWNGVHLGMNSNQVISAMRNSGIVPSDGGKGRLFKNKNSGQQPDRIMVSYAAHFKGRPANRIIWHYNYGKRRHKEKLDQLYNSLVTKYGKGKCKGDYRCSWERNLNGWREELTFQLGLGTNIQLQVKEITGPNFGNLALEEPSQKNSPSTSVVLNDFDPKTLYGTKIGMSYMEARNALKKAGFIPGECKDSSNLQIFNRRKKTKSIKVTLSYPSTTSNWKQMRTKRECADEGITISQIEVKYYNSEGLAESADSIVNRTNQAFGLKGSCKKPTIGTTIISCAWSSLPDKSLVQHAALSVAPGKIGYIVKRNVNAIKGSANAKPSLPPGTSHTNDGEDLVKAASNGDLTTVRAMLEKKIDINYKNEIGLTALMAASFTSHVEIVQALLAKGANIDLRAKEGVTALIAASLNGHAEVIQILLAKGAKIDLRAKDGFTALAMASEKGHTEVVQILLAKGAQIDLGSKDGVTALMMASQNGHTEVVQILLAKGAKIDHQNKADFTSLMGASMAGQARVIQILLAKGAKIDLRAKGGYTALMFASQNGHTEVVQILLAKGAQIDFQAKDGRTALMLASQNGHTKVARPTS